jgi:D-alanine-D-alanine ligase
MLNHRLEIVVLCGGQSTEHAVSVQSARNVVLALDQEKYAISVVYISQQGGWHRLHDATMLQQENHQQWINPEFSESLVLAPGNGVYPLRSAQQVKLGYRIDCIIPMVHGTLCEDGALQGLLDVLGLPYVGSETLSSALCMSKPVSKQLLRAAGLPTIDWILLDNSQSTLADYAQMSERLGQTLFVKPASLGSSVGMNKVRNEQQFKEALAEAWRFDEKVLVEPYIEGREIECAVLGNDNPEASVLGEIIPQYEFYTYIAKYIDPQGAILEMPAQLEQSVAAKIQEIAIAAFKALFCRGMARVDFFLLPDGTILLNELNTLPGFTNMSMYPKLWELSGLPYAKLLDRLIALALQRFKKQQQLTRIYAPDI